MQHYLLNHHPLCKNLNIDNKILAPMSPGCEINPKMQKKISGKTKPKQMTLAIKSSIPNVAPWGCRATALQLCNFPSKDSKLC